MRWAAPRCVLGSIFVVVAAACSAGDPGAGADEPNHASDDSVSGVGAPSAANGGMSSGGASGSGDVSSAGPAVGSGGSGQSVGSGGGGGTGTGGGAMPIDCSTYPYDTDALLAERVGFGAAAEGGDPDNIYHVTNTKGDGSGSLKEALESSEPYWIVFDVQGKITLGDGVAFVESYKTIDGRGRDVTIEGNLILNDARHVIINDVSLTNDLEGHCTQEGDVITVNGTGTTDPHAFTSRHLWFHQLELYNGGDGLIDLRGASLVTLSWSHLHTHKKAMLMWKDKNGDFTPGMRVTAHHNLFDRITLRSPQFYYGWAHFFNNHHHQWYEYGAGSFANAQFYSEQNVYEARPDDYCLVPCPDPAPCGDSDFTVSKSGLVDDWYTYGKGNVKSVGDLPMNGATMAQNNPASVFDPANEYAYAADTASAALMADIGAHAGPRTDYCQP